jgi:uncharacterized protein YceH (UPF0502 family)
METIINEKKSELLLTEKEVRVISSLVEKKYTTPEYYPLSLNSLTNACNQKSNRNPVVNYSEVEVEETIDLLRAKRFVRKVEDTGRVHKYKESFTEELNLTLLEIAVLNILMLRGPQTTGEIRTRSNRIFDFENLNSVEETLQKLIDREEGALVKKLDRQTGMKERRYAHLLCGDVVTEEKQETIAEQETNKLYQLETMVINLQSEIDELKNQFADFRKQFD